LEAREGYVAGLVLTHHALGAAFDLVFRKNEAMVGGLPWNSLVFMEFEDGGGVFELALLVAEAFVLDVAELIESLLELAREAGAVQSEVGQKAMGVDDVEGGGLGAGGRGLGAFEHVNLEEWDAIYAPGSVGELLDQLGFGCGGGLVFVGELAAVAQVCGRVL
jgi:hypothetical protein